MDIRYPATVESQDDGSFLVQFIDLPDTFTEGKTKEEALFNATEVLSGMLAWRLDQSKGVPAPSQKVAGAHYIAPDAKTQDVRAYALNSASVALADVKQQKVLMNYHLNQAQPDISAYLKQLAIKIAIESPEVQNALGIKPAEKDALMASTKTSLNRSRCERSRHLCVAPTFVKEDKALWAIVDLTDQRLVGIRWTNVGTTGPSAGILGLK